MTRRVLVVDDAPDIRAVARMCLERVRGWAVLEAASGREAVAMALAEQPDAVLLDVHMPREDGLATFARLQQDERTSAIPVLLLTARQDDAAQPWPDGIRGVLAKPFDPLALAQQVSDALGWSE